MTILTRKSAFLPAICKLGAKSLLAFTVAAMLVSCEGIFQNIYDNPPPETEEKAGRLLIDASSWNDWYYLDFKALDDSLKKDKRYNPSDAVVRISIPTEETQKSDNPDSQNADGIYVYWYDVYGAGISNNVFQQFIPTETQEEPSAWSVAFHRNNVRTNGASVFETEYTRMEDLPESSLSFDDAPFVEDEWNETDVWVLREQMLNGIIGNQGIRTNRVLSNWLTVEIPPIPPAFSLNNHVFIVRLPEGTYAALQLENYQSEKGTKCVLTINYIYPY